jgi:hypothetical protein
VRLRRESRSPLPAESQRAEDLAAPEGAELKTCGWAPCFREESRRRARPLLEGTWGAGGVRGPAFTLGEGDEMPPGPPVVEARIVRVCQTLARYSRLNPLESDLF